MTSNITYVHITVKSGRNISSSPWHTVPSTNLNHLSPHATVSQDGVGASLLSPLPMSALCFGLPRDQLAYWLWGIAVHACAVASKLEPLT